MNFTSHRSELLRVLSNVQQNALESTRIKTSPPRYSSSILSILCGKPVDNYSIGHSIRQIHDFYGWMAKHHKDRGTCAGTIYRTANFMKIESRQRNGTRSELRNIHIEHTVPVSVLKKSLEIEFKKSGFKTPNELHHFLMNYSICVAFHHDEEKWLGQEFSGVAASTNEAFDHDGNKVHEFPFRRYQKLLNWSISANRDFRIINILTGKEIDLLSFSFNDHAQNLDEASRLIKKSVGCSPYSLDIFGSNI